VDLLERRFKKTSEKLRSRAGDALQVRGPGRTQFEKELQQFRAKVRTQPTTPYVVDLSEI
jgi:hypothetical protein